MTLHIGICAGTPASATRCLTAIGIGAAAQGPLAAPEITLHAKPWERYRASLEIGDMPGVGELMLDSARKLDAAGCDFVICPDDTLHEAFAIVAPRSPLPWLHIAEVVAAEARRRGFRRLGLVGSRRLVESNVYPEILVAEGIDYLRPPPADREAIDACLRAGIQPSAPAEGVRRLLTRVVDDSALQGCEAMVLSGAGLIDAIDPASASLPLLDSTSLLAEAALERALADAMPVI